MADRLERIKKEQKRMPKVPQTMDGPRRISQGTIGVRKRDSSRRSSVVSELAAANPFRDMVPSGPQVKVLTSTNHQTGRTQHLRRRSKTPIRHLQHVLPLLTDANGMKPRKLSMGKLVSHKEHAKLAAALRNKMPTMSEHDQEHQHVEDEEDAGPAGPINPRKSISIGATQVKLVPNIQPKKSPKLKSSAGSEVSGTSYQSGRSSRSHRSSASRTSHGTRASSVVTLTKDELSRQHLVQPRRLRQSFEMRQQGLSEPVVESAPPRPKSTIAPRAAPALRPAEALAATVMSAQKSSSGFSTTSAQRPESLKRTPSGLGSAPVITAAKPAVTYQPARNAPEPPVSEAPPVVEPPELAPAAWTPGTRKPSIAPMHNPAAVALAAPVPPASAPPTFATDAKQASTPPRPMPINVQRLSLTPPYGSPMRIQQSPLYSPKGTRMEPRSAGYMPRRPSGPISPRRMLRQGSRASLSDGFVQEDDEETKTNIANSKIELYLASLNERKPTVNQLENLPTANDVIAHHKRQRQLSFKTSQGDAKQNAWIDDDDEEQAESETEAVQAPRKPSHRHSQRPSVSSQTTRTSTSQSADQEKDFKPEQGAMPNGMDPDEIFRGVKVGWLVATYNDYLAHVSKREAKKAAKAAKHKEAPVRSPSLPELDLSSPVASPILKQIPANAQHQQHQQQQPQPQPQSQPQPYQGQLKSILKVSGPQPEDAAPAVPNGPAAEAKVVEERKKAVAADKEAAQARWRASLSQLSTGEAVPYKTIAAPQARAASPPISPKPVAVEPKQELSAPQPVKQETKVPQMQQEPQLQQTKPNATEAKADAPVQKLWSSVPSTGTANPAAQHVQAQVKPKPAHVASLAKLESGDVRPSVSGPRDLTPPPMSATQASFGDRVKIYSNEMTFYDPFAKHSKPSSLRESIQSAKSDGTPVASPELTSGALVPARPISGPVPAATRFAPVKSAQAPVGSPAAAPITAPAIAPPVAPALAPSHRPLSRPLLSVAQSHSTSSRKSYDLVKSPTSPVSMMKKASQRSSSGASDASFEEFMSGGAIKKKGFEAVSSKAQKILGLRNKSPREARFKAADIEGKRSSINKHRISVHDISGPLELQKKEEHQRQMMEALALQQANEPRIESPVPMTPEQISLAQFMREANAQQVPPPKPVLSPLWQRDSVSATRQLVSPFKPAAVESNRSSSDSTSATGLIPVGIEARRASSIYSPAQALYNMDQVKSPSGRFQDTPDMNGASPMQELFKDYSLSPSTSQQQFQPVEPVAQAQPVVQRQPQIVQQKHRFKPVHQLETIAQSPQMSQASPDASTPNSNNSGRRDQQRAQPIAKTPPTSAPAGLGISSPEPVSPTHVMRFAGSRGPLAQELRSDSPEPQFASVAESNDRRKQPTKQQTKQKHLSEPVERTRTTSPMTKKPVKPTSSQGSREPTPDPFRNLKIPGGKSPKVVLEEQSSAQETAQQRKKAPGPLNLAAAEPSMFDSMGSGSTIQFRSPFGEQQGVPSPIRPRPAYPERQASARRSPDYVATQPQYPQPQADSRQPRVMALTESDTAKHVDAAESRARQKMSPSSSEHSHPSEVQVALTGRQGEYHPPQPSSARPGQKFDFRSALERSTSIESHPPAATGAPAQNVVGEVTDSLNYYAGTATAAFSKWFS